MKKLLIMLMFIFSQTVLGKDNSIPVFAFSDSSCGTWFKTKDNPTTKQVYSFWFRGFVSGYNYGNNDYYVNLGTLPNDDTIFLYVDKYCRENPLNQFTPSMFSLVDEIKQKR